MVKSKRAWRERRRTRVERSALACSSPPSGTTLTAQLLPHFLAAGELPRAEVGDVLEIAPAVYVAASGSSPAADRWSSDEFGTVEAVGAVLGARLDPDGGCSCRVDVLDVLDVAGRLLPLNWADAGDGTGRLRIEGAVYLDPELAPGTAHGDAVVLCRRRYRVRAIRRYRRTRECPVEPAPIAAFPVPGEASEEAVYVADLEAEPDLAPSDRRG